MRGGAGGGGGGGSRARRGVGPSQAQAGGGLPACCPQPPEVGGRWQRRPRLLRHQPGETESPRPPEFPLYDGTRCVGFKSSPDCKAAGMSFDCSTPTSSNGTLSLQETAAAARRSFPRWPLLGACSHRKAAGAPPSLSLTPASRQSWRWEGENGPRNCLKIVPLLEDALDPLRKRRRLPTSAVSVVQS